MIDKSYILVQGLNTFLWQLPHWNNTASFNRSSAIYRIKWIKFSQQNDIPGFNFHFYFSKEADVAPISLSKTFERNQVIDITFPVIYQDFYILYPKHEKEEEGPLLLVTKPFHYEVSLVINQFQIGFSKINSFSFRFGCHWRPSLSVYSR